MSSHSTGALFATPISFFTDSGSNIIRALLAKITGFTITTLITTFARTYHFTIAIQSWVKCASETRVITESWVSNRWSWRTCGNFTPWIR